VTQILLVSRFAEALSLVAAIDSGALGGTTRRILLTVDDTEIPEIALPFTETLGFGAVSDRFDEVVSYNELISPQHPAHWEPHETDLGMLRTLLRSHLGLGGDPPELVVEAALGRAARSLAELLDDAVVTVYADGPSCYGPTPATPLRHVATRVERLIHPDLVPGLTPLTLSEYGVARVPLDPEALRSAAAAVAEHAAEHVDASGPHPATLLLGPSSRSGLGLTVHALNARARAGDRTLALKPHPDYPFAPVAELRAAAERAGVGLRVLEGSVPVEAWYAAHPPELVVGAPSAALDTAARVFGIPVATLGTEPLLRDLTPYQHPSRIPLLLADTTLPRLLGSGEIRPPRIGAEAYAEELVPLVHTVAYCMRAAAYPHLREEAAAHLAGFGGDPLPHFRRKRLRGLGLPVPGEDPQPTGLAGAVRRSARRLLRALPMPRTARGGTLSLSSERRRARR